MSKVIANLLEGQALGKQTAGTGMAQRVRPMMGAGPLEGLQSGGDNVEEPTG